MKKYTLLLLLSWSVNFLGKSEHDHDEHQAEKKIYQKMMIISSYAINLGALGFISAARKDMQQAYSDESEIAHNMSLAIMSLILTAGGGVLFDHVVKQTIALKNKASVQDDKS